MRSAFYDYPMALVSMRKEKKRREEGELRNRNLPPNTVAKINYLKQRCQARSTVAMYELALMYLNGDEAGYNPDWGRYYLECGTKLNDFYCSYALARYYRGHWSFQHVDAYKSMINYSISMNCKNADPAFLQEATHAYNNDFGVENTKKGLQVWFNVELPIK